MREILKMLKSQEDAVKRKDKELGDKDNEIKQLKKLNEKLSKEVQTASGENVAMKDTLDTKLTKAQQDRLLHGKKSPWSSTDFGSALIVLGAGKKVYSYINSQFSYLLPCVSSIKSYMSSIRFEPGIMEDVLTLMEFAGKKMSPLEKVLFMSYDEMHTDPICCHDQKLDQILGPCSQVQVVNVRGLFSPYKNPIFYQFDCPIDGWPERLSKELHKRGFLVAGIVCDLGTNNQKFFRQAGVTLEKPFIEHPVTSSPIICMYDPPHNLKLARNYLLDEDICLNPSDKSNPRIANKAPLVELVNLPIMPDLRRHKVRLRHLSVKGSERQSVSTAMELLSGSAATSLLEAGRRKLIQALNFEVHYYDTVK